MKFWIAYWCVAVLVFGLLVASVINQEIKIETMDTRIYLKCSQDDPELLEMQMLRPRLRNPDLVTLT